MYCKNCGRALPEPKRASGQPRVFCGERCRVAYFRKQRVAQPKQVDSRDTEILMLRSQLEQAQQTIAELEMANKQLTQRLVEHRQMQLSQPKSRQNHLQPLPEGMISLYGIIMQHNVKALDIRRLVVQGFIHVVKGAWLNGKGVRVEEALDQAGQREFWVQCHVLAGFTSCDQCPHECL